MSTVSGTRRASRRQPQDAYADKIVVDLNGQPQDAYADKIVVDLDASSPVVGRHHGVSTSSAGARTSPIDVEALEDEVHDVSPSRVPPQRGNQRTRRQSVIVLDLEVDTSREGVFHGDDANVPSHNTRNKRQRVAPIIHLSPETGEASSLQSNNAVKTSKAPANVAPKEPIFTCPVCWNKLDEPSATICGHIFCTNCIEQAIQFQKKCPTCRKSLKKNNFHRIYLPNSVG